MVSHHCNERCTAAKRTRIIANGIYSNVKRSRIIARPFYSNVDAKGVIINVQGRRGLVDNAQGELIGLYDIAGRCLATEQSHSLRHTLPTTGISLGEIIEGSERADATLREISFGRLEEKM